MTQLHSQPGYLKYEGKAIDQDAIDFYQENGYLVLENALQTNETQELLQDAAKICRGEYGTFQGWQGPHDDLDDEQVLKQYLCVHFPHKISEVMHGYLSHRGIVDVLTGVIGPNVKCMQSMLFIKAAGKPGQAWHQDEDFIPTRDRSLAGAWIALDDATTENGCLWVIPGSHRHGVLWPQFEQDDPRFDCTDESRQFPYTDDDAVPVEVSAGSIVFFNGYLLHRSLPNISQGYRRVLVNHYMSAESLLPWYGPNGLSERVAISDSRDVVMVAGQDPYAWKNITHERGTHVRPSGEGGCHR